MKKVVTGALGTFTILSFTAAALAQMPEDTKPETKVEILERNAQGKATKVKIDGSVVAVCMNEQMTDDCINPRAAGLNWGNYPANTFERKDDKGPTAPPR